MVLLCVKCNNLDLSGVFLQIQTARQSSPEPRDASCILGCDSQLRKRYIEVPQTEDFMLRRGLEEVIYFMWVWCYIADMMFSCILLYLILTIFHFRDRRLS